MALVTAPRFCGTNLPHTWVNLYLRISKCHMVVHALCAWTTLLFTHGVMWIVHVLCLWTTPLLRQFTWTFGSRLMDKPFGRTWDVIFTIPIPSVTPLSNGCPKTLFGFNAQLCGSDQNFFIFLVWATCHDFVGWPVKSIAFFKRLPCVFFWMVGVASLTPFLGPINRYIPSLAPHNSQNSLLSHPRASSSPLPSFVRYFLFS